MDSSDCPLSKIRVRSHWNCTLERLDDLKRFLIDERFISTGRVRKFEEFYLVPFQSDDGYYRWPKLVYENGLWRLSVKRQTYQTPHAVFDEELYDLSDFSLNNVSMLFGKEVRIMVSMKIYRVVFRSQKRNLTLKIDHATCGEWSHCIASMDSMFPKRRLDTLSEFSHPLIPFSKPCRSKFTAWLEAFHPQILDEISDKKAISKNVPVIVSSLSFKQYYDLAREVDPIVKAVRFQIDILIQTSDTEPITPLFLQ